MKALIAILGILSLALAVALMMRHQKAQSRQREDHDQISLLSNEWVQTRAKLADQEKVNTSLETNLDLRAQELLAVSNKFLDASNKLLDVSSTLQKVETEARAAAKTAQEEMAKRDGRISELETERDALTQKMIALNTSITKLETQITDTERKLTASEGDRDFLLKELKRLQAEKAELERQFNDLAVLREQVRKLKEELSIARRLEWIRRGIYGEQKGGQRLQAGVPSTAPKPRHDLDVEINRDGSARVVPPATNAPVQTNTPAPAKP